MVYSSEEYSKERRRELYERNKKSALFQKRKWRKDNPDKVKAANDKSAAKRIQNGKQYAYMKKRKAECPWVRTFYSIASRVNDAKLGKLPRYAGIEKRIKTAELKELWFRDKAYDMKDPTIDRVDPTGHYTFENCRYIERAVNNARRRIPKKYKNK